MPLIGAGQRGIIAIQLTQCDLVRVSGVELHVRPNWRKHERQRLTNVCNSKHHGVRVSECLRPVDDRAGPGGHDDHCAAQRATARMRERARSASRA